MHRNLYLYLKIFFVPTYVLCMNLATPTYAKGGEKKKHCHDVIVGNININRLI